MGGINRKAATETQWPASFSKLTRRGSGGNISGWPVNPCFENMCLRCVCVSVSGLFLPGVDSARTRFLQSRAEENVVCGDPSHTALPLSCYDPRGKWEWIRASFNLRVSLEAQAADSCQDISLSLYIPSTVKGFLFHWFHRGLFVSFRICSVHVCLLFLK